MSALIHDLNVTFLLFVVAIIGLSLVTVIVRAQRRPVATGVEGMIGAIVVTSTALLPEGRVSYQGEDWTAVLDAPAIAPDPGTELRIVAVEGLCLRVKPVVDILSYPSPTYMRGACRNWMNCWRSAIKSIANCKQSSTSIRSAGA